jgi:hypothetical protein
MFSTHVEAPKYARAGWPIFPLQTYSKEPKFAGGFHIATTDPATIERWWREDLAANIGLHCKDYVVLDADGPEGQESLAKLAAQFGSLPETLRQKTPREDGGTHHIFKKPSGIHVPNSAGKIGRKLDIRSQDGYIVLAPSVHPETRTSYRWDTPDGEAIGHEIAECPDWLLELAIAPAPRKVVAKRSENDGQWSPANVIEEGQRHSVMMSLAGITARQHLDDPDLVLGIMRRKNETRCSPPLPDAELESIVAAALAYAEDEERPPEIRIVREAQPVGDAPVQQAATQSETLADECVNGRSAVHDFTTALRLNRSGQVKPNSFNAVHLLTYDPDWRDCVTYDSFEAALGHCQVERLRLNAILDECWIACTVVIGSREKSSRNAFGSTSVSASAFAMWRN